MASKPTRADARKAARDSWESLARVLNVSGKGTLRPFIRARLGVFKSRTEDKATLPYDAIADATYARFIEGVPTADVVASYRKATESKSNK